MNIMEMVCWNTAAAILLLRDSVITQFTVFSDIRHVLAFAKKLKQLMSMVKNLRILLYCALNMEGCLLLTE